MDPGKEKHEKEGKKDFPLDVLAHLELLEAQHRGWAEAQERQEQLQEREKFLKSRIQELRQRRDALREKVRQAVSVPKNHLGIPGFWLFQELGNLGIASEPDPREVLEWKIQKCRELLRLFRLTGISGKLSPHGISLSLHTSFEGSLLDSFHLELQERGDSGRFWLCRHSVPPFIPLERLARELLPRNPRQFLGILCRHLNTFVGRREQLRKLQV
ncbi:centromere protein O, partial [Catharus ustulatus]|uniref:centromere protein O n=1 Tax=Catharus ustulatus TaxID=91951 RepID=UPI00140D7EF8